MSKCENCRLRKESAKAFDIHWHGEDDCPYDKCPLPNFPKTNADHIRAMTDEELADLFSTWVRDCGCNDVPCYDFCLPNRYDCVQNWLDWLKQEATE